MKDCDVDFMKTLTFNQYRTINMLMLTIVFAVVDTLIALGANIWFPELPYTLSIAVIFMSLEIMRWGVFGAVSAVVAGIVFCLASGANGDQFIIYGVGNLASLLSLLYLKLLGSDKVRKDGTYTTMYVLIVFVLVQLGRWLVSCILGNDIRMIIQFVTTDALSGVFAAVVLNVLRTADGLFENQKSYIIRLQKEREAKKNEEEYTE